MLTIWDSKVHEKIREALGSFFQELGGDPRLNQPYERTLFSSRRATDAEIDVMKTIAKPDFSGGGEYDLVEAASTPTPSSSPSSSSTSSTSSTSILNDYRNDQSSSSQIKTGRSRSAIPGFSAAPPRGLDIEDKKFYDTNRTYVVYHFAENMWVRENDDIKRIRLALAKYLCSCIAGSPMSHIPMTDQDC